MMTDTYECREQALHCLANLLQDSKEISRGVISKVASLVSIIQSMMGCDKVNTKTAETAALCIHHLVKHRLIGSQEDLYVAAIVNSSLVKCRRAPNVLIVALQTLQLLSDTVDD